MYFVVPRLANMGALNILFAYTVFLEKGMAMVASSAQKKISVAAWKSLLDDRDTLMEAPVAHHKVLVQRASALHQSQVIGCAELSDMLELADGALAYAIEAQLDA